MISLHHRNLRRYSAWCRALLLGMLVGSVSACNGVMSWRSPHSSTMEQTAAHPASVAGSVPVAASSGPSAPASASSSTAATAGETTAQDVASSTDKTASADADPRPGAAEQIAEPPAYLPGATPDNSRPAVEFDTHDQTRTLALRFQPLDVIKVQIWGYPELDDLAEVQPNGMVTLPLVGEVPAAGATVDELRRDIGDRLKPFTRTEATVLRDGDALTMDVWQHPELRGTSEIDPLGKITFPLAGRVAARGRELEDIRQEVEQRLLQYVSDARVTLLPTYNNRRVLYDPAVSVLAAKLEARRVAVIGEVGSPGLVEIRGSLRIVEALAQAYVNDKTAKMNSVLVIRESASGPQYKTLRIADYLAGEAPDQNIFLQHKDIVIVPKSLITKVGEFVDQFLSKTAPVFAWWIALNQSTVALESADTVRLINKSLEKQLIDISVGPK